MSFGNTDYGVQREILVKTNEPINAAMTYGPFFVAGNPWMYLSFNGSAARMRFQVQYFYDEACTRSVDNDAVVINGDASIAGGYFTGPIPVFGPWVLVVVEASSYPATFSCKFGTALDAQAATGGEGSAGRIYHANPTNVGAGATVTAFANCSWRGTAGLFLELPAVVGAEFRIESLQLTGLVRLVYKKTNAAAVLSQEYVPDIALHTDAIRIILVNPGGAAADFRAQLIGARRSG